VVGSIIIAAGAVIVALYIMFIMLRPKLKHTWASKLAVAVILAIAVCAMHFCGESKDIDKFVLIYFRHDGHDLCVAARKRYRLP
jgi:NO-binding membrane sensor protein with MHYT domain